MKPGAEASGGCPLCACGPAQRLAALAAMVLVVAVLSAWVWSAKPAAGPKPADNAAWHQLTARLATAEDVVVAPGPMFRQPATQRATAVTLTDSRPLLTRLQLDPRQPGTTCGCPPVVSLEFRAHGQRLALLELIHGRAVRWVDGPWQGDARLSRASAESLSSFLEAQGLAVGRPQWDVR